MRKSLGIKSPILIFLSLCLMILTPSAMAMEKPVVEVEVDTAVILSGKTPEIHGEFLVELIADEKNFPMPAGSDDGVFTLVVTVDGEVHFPKIFFDKVGVYTYKILEVAQSSLEFTDDSHVYELTVIVTNDEYVGLEASAALYREDQRDKWGIAEFYVHYSYPALVKLEATKLLDDQVPEDDSFTFLLKDEEGEILQRVSNKAGKVLFDEFELRAEGASVYYITEEAGTDKDIIYDNSEYKVIVDVSKKADGDYEAKTSYEKENKLIDGVPIFKNTSSAKAALIKLQAEKTLDDKAPKDGRFSFILTDEKGQVLQRKSNKEGKILFDEFPIKEEGSKIFYLKEEVGTDKDIIYDKSEYKVIVVTKKDKDGNYEASITYKKAGKTFEGSPIFKNKIKVKTLPSTGQAKSSIPLLGGGLLLVGIALTFSQKKKEN